MINADEGCTGRRLLRARLLDVSSSETERAVFSHLGVLLVVSAMPSRSWIVSRCGVPFLSAKIARRRTATFGSRAASSCSSDRYAVDVTGMRAREPLERDQRRAAHGRALVLEARGGAARASAGSGTGRSRGTRRARVR